MIRACKAGLVAGIVVSSFVLLDAQSQMPSAKAAPDWTAEFNTAREKKTFAADGKSKSIRIVSWNIDRGEELNTIGAELKKNSADLYLLQEVDWNTVRAARKDVAAELANVLHANFAYGIEFEELSQEQEGKRAFIGQATLTSLPVLKTRVLRFKKQSGFWKPHSWIPSSIPLMQRRLGNRIALVTELEFAGKPLVVYNVHLESRSYGRIQAEQLDEVIADLQTYPPHTAAIIGGDINSKYLPSVFLHKMQKEGFQSATGNRIERTHTIVMALDWIFARGPFQFEEGTVRRDLKGSDHYPIYADLVAH